MIRVIVGVTGICRGFDQDGGASIAVGEMVVSVSRMPDLRTERYQGTPAEFRAATAPEMAGYDAALATQQDADAGAAFDTDKALRAVALSNLARALGKNPSAVTPAEMATERARIVAIYKGLP